MAAVWSGRGQTDPEWTALAVEFWTHAARDDEFREALRARNRAQIEAMTELVEQLLRRHEVAAGIGAPQVARVALALGRGLSVEQLVVGESEAELEELLVQTTHALIRPAADG